MNKQKGQLLRSTANKVRTNLPRMAKLRCRLYGWLWEWEGGKNGEAGKLERMRNMGCGSHFKGYSTSHCESQARRRKIAGSTAQKEP